MEKSDSLEKAAAWIHDIWSRWFRHQRDTSDLANVSRWNDQSNTPYGSLSEVDKEKDREIVRTSPLWEELKRLHDMNSNQQRYINSLLNDDVCARCRGFVYEKYLDALAAVNEKNKELDRIRERSP